MTYRIDLTAPSVLVPCAFIPSMSAPGTMLCVNEDGSALVVEPDGSQTRTVPPGDPNFDSPWTQGTVLSGFLVYRSANEHTQGTPRAYRMIG